MCDSDGFQFVKKKGRRNYKTAKPQHTAIMRNCDENLSTFDHDLFKRKLDSCVQDVRLSDFFQETYDLTLGALCEILKEKQADLDNADKDLSALSISDEINPANDNDTKFVPAAQSLDLLSYGLGSFSSCPIARYQLSFLIVMREKLSNICRSCVLYDPVFNKQEVDVLTSLGFSVLSHNEEGKRKCEQLTLSFLPHCGKALYNNYLWKNLEDQGIPGLHNLVVIGNSFSRMVERLPDRVLMKTANYVLKVQPYTREVSLPLTFPHTDVFNDLSLHWWPRTQINKLPTDLLNNLAEPVYDDDDAELIKK